jgi:hypothetical protein
VRSLFSLLVYSTPTNESSLSCLTLGQENERATISCSNSIQRGKKREGKWTAPINWAGENTYGQLNRRIQEGVRARVLSWAGSLATFIEEIPKTLLLSRFPLHGCFWRIQIEALLAVSTEHLTFGQWRRYVLFLYSLFSWIRALLLLDQMVEIVFVPNLEYFFLLFQWLRMQKKMWRYISFIMQFTDENLSNFILNVRANMQLVIPMAFQEAVFLRCSAWHTSALPRWWSTQSGSRLSVHR